MQNSKAYHVVAQLDPGVSNFKQHESVGSLLKSVVGSGCSPEDER